VLAPIIPRRAPPGGPAGLLLRPAPQRTTAAPHQMAMEGLEFLVRHGYLVLFGVVLGEQLGLPLVGAPVLLAAGALSGTGRFSLLGVVCLPIVACLVGDAVWFQLGRHRGASVLTLLCRISLEPDSCVRRTENVFSRWGARVLLVAKFVPGLNTVAPPLAGVVKMPLGRFLRYDLTGAFLWTVAYVGLGYLASSQLEAVGMAVAGLGRGAGLVVGVALAAYVGWKYLQRRRFLRSLRVARITPEELVSRMQRGDAPVIIDLRTAEHVAADGLRIPGALHIHPDELDQRHGDIARDREIILYCS
jgi:membrane protein DedA with SNARE-associated domain